MTKIHLHGTSMHMQKRKYNNKHMLTVKVMPHFHRAIAIEMSLAMGIIVSLRIVSTESKR